MDIKQASVDDVWGALYEILDEYRDEDTFGKLPNEYQGAFASFFMATAESWDDKSLTQRAWKLSQIFAAGHNWVANYWPLW